MGGLIKVTCGSCQAKFVIKTTFSLIKLNPGERRPWYCPNGHEVFSLQSELTAQGEG